MLNSQIPVIQRLLVQCNVCNSKSSDTWGDQSAILVPLSLFLAGQLLLVLLLPLFQNPLVIQIQLQQKHK